MRIAIGLHSMLLGGSQINTIDLAAELRRRGHDVVLFAIDPIERSASIEPVAAEASLDIVRLDPSGGFRTQAKRITELVDATDAEILHVFHEDGHLGPIAALALRSRPGTALVVTNWMMANTHWIPPHATLLVGFRALQREASSFHRGPIGLIEPPVNTERDRVTEADALAFRVRWGIAHDDVSVTLVSRIDHVMKLDSIMLAIRAVRSLSDPRLRLVIVGDGDAMDTVTDAAAETNAAMGRQTVVLTGSLSDPRPAYGAADIVIGMGGSALRGLAFGKPVVVVGSGTFSRLFDEQSAEYFVEHGFTGDADDDPDGRQLAATLARLADPAARAELGAVGTGAVEERYSLDALTTKLEGIYRHSIDRPTNWWHRWYDVGFVLTYHLAHRALADGMKQRIRRALPRLRSGGS
jgi:glycosyltransferase involved in cell wall biosynthesis